MDGLPNLNSIVGAAYGRRCMLGDSFGILHFLVNFDCGYPQNCYVAECIKTRIAAFNQ